MEQRAGMETVERPEAFRVAFVQILVPSYKLPMFQMIGRSPGVELHVFSGDQGPPMMAKAAPVSGVRHSLVKNLVLKLGPFFLVWQRNLNRLLQPSSFNLVLLPDGVLFLSNYLLMLRCMFRRIPFGFYSHGFNHRRQPGWFGAVVEKWRGVLFRRASVVIVYSSEGLQYLVDKHRVARQRVHVAPNTLDTRAIANRIAKFSKDQVSACRASLSVADDALLLAYIGRLEPEKNPEWILYTVEQLTGSGIPAHAVFVGSGSELEALRAKVRNSTRLEKSVSFIGDVQVDQVDLYLAAADICVMPGMTGLALVHAFAAGKPYVTIRAAGHSPEITYLRDGLNGVLAEPTPEGFYQAVLPLARDKELRLRLGRAGSEDAQNILSMDQQIDGFRRAFKAVAESTSMLSG